MDAAQQESLSQIAKLKVKLAASQIPKDIKDKLQEDMVRIEVLSKTNQFSPEIDKELKYIDFVCDLPWVNVGQDVLDIHRAKQILDKNHFGLDTIKDRILEYLSVLILNKQQNLQNHQPVL